MKKVIGGKQYDTESAREIASNDFSDGSNRLRNGRGSTLYKTEKGAFFMLHETCWQGEHDNIEPLSERQAKESFEELSGDADVYVEIFGEPEKA